MAISVEGAHLVPVRPNIIRLSRCVVLATLAGLLRVSPAAAQAELGLSLGAYLPLGSGALVKEYGGVNGGPVPYPVLEKWHVGSAVIAVRPTYWLTPRVGIEATFADVPGKVSTRDSLNAVREQTGYLFVLSARTPVRLNPPSAPVVLQLSPGVALLKRGGKTWTGYQGTTDGAGVLGLGARGTLGRRSKLWFRLELEVYLSAAQFTNARYDPTQRRLHQDVMFTIGVIYSSRRPPRPSSAR